MGSQRVSVRHERGESEINKEVNKSTSQRPCKSPVDPFDIWKNWKSWVVGVGISWSFRVRRLAKVMLSAAIQGNPSILFKGRVSVSLNADMRTLRWIIINTSQHELLACLHQLVQLGSWGKIYNSDALSHCFVLVQPTEWQQDNICAKIEVLLTAQEFIVRLVHNVFPLSRKSLIDDKWPRSHQKLGEISWNILVNWQLPTSVIIFTQNKVPKAHGRVVYFVKLRIRVDQAVIGYFAIVLLGIESFVRKSRYPINEINSPNAPRVHVSSRPCWPKWLPWPPLRARSASDILAMLSHPTQPRPQNPIQRSMRPIKSVNSLSTRVVSRNGWNGECVYSPFFTFSMLRSEQP